MTHRDNSTADRPVAATGAAIRWTDSQQLAHAIPVEADRRMAALLWRRYAGALAGLLDARRAS